MIKKYSTPEVRERAAQAVLEGHLVTDVANLYQVHRSNVYRWMSRYREGGSMEALARKEGSGKKPILDDDAMEKICETVLRPASERGYETDFWTCRRLIQVAEKELGIQVSQPTMWRTLRASGLTWQKPERRYKEADEAKRREWIRREIPKILETVRKHKAILYFEDEANVSLTAPLGKTWAPAGQTPTQSVTGARGGVSAMSAISRRGDLVFTLHEKRIASGEVVHFLDQLLKHHPRRHVVVVMDQARPHTSKATRAFVESQRRLHVFYLPPYSPDFIPDEQAWNRLKHFELKSHQAQTKQELKALTKRKLKNMSKQPRLLRGILFCCGAAYLLN